jgi:HEAT repeat protein
MKRFSILFVLSVLSFSCFLCVYAKENASSSSNIQDLINQLENPNEEIKSDAINALAKLGSKAKPAVPALALLLKDKSNYVRNFSASALAEIGPDAASAVPALKEAMHDSDPSVSQAAHGALGAIGPAAVSAIPDLILFLRDWESSSQECPAAFALVRIGDASVPELIKLIKDEEKRNVLKAVWCLGEIKPPSPQSLSGLLLALNHGNPEVIERAASTLRSLGVPAIPYLIKGLDASDPDVRKQAAWALGNIGTSAKQALTKLETMGKKDKDSSVKAACNWSVLKIKGEHVPEE